MPILDYIVDMTNGAIELSTQYLMELFLTTQQNDVPAEARILMTFDNKHTFVRKWSICSVVDKKVIGSVTETRSLWIHLIYTPRMVTSGPKPLSF